MSVFHHLNWLRQIQPTRIKVSNLTIGVPLSLTPLLLLLFLSTHPIQCAVSTQAQTQSASNDCFIDEARVYSLTQACNNYKPNQLERRENARDGDPAGEYPSYINCGLNNGELGRLSISSTVEAKYKKVLFDFYCIPSGFALQRAISIMQDQLFISIYK